MLIEHSAHVEVVAVVVDFIVETEVASTVNPDGLPSVELGMGKFHFPGNPSTFLRLLGVQYIELAMGQMGVLTFEISNELIGTVQVVQVVYKFNVVTVDRTQGLEVVFVQALVDFDESL